MGWGTNYVFNGYLNKMTFRGKSEVQDKIDENIDIINDTKQRLKMFVAATPNSIIPSEWSEQPIDWLSNETNNWFEMMEDAIKENVLLYQYLEYLEDITNQDKLLIDWHDLNHFYNKTTVIAYSCGVVNGSLDDDLPTFEDKNQMEKYILDYGK